MKRIVIDTNLYVSSLINANSRYRLDQVLQNRSLIILLDDVLLSELQEVIFRPKFNKYVKTYQIEAYLALLAERGTFIQTTSIVRYSPDPKDDFLLALCQDGAADYLLTGNKIDLLELKNFNQTVILSLTDFLNLNLE